MRLISRDGGWLDLRVLRRQQVEQRAVELSRADWSQTWLLVRGEARTAQDRHWTFRDPCLTPWEAQRLGSWLRTVARSPERVLGAGLLFSEPSLSFVLDATRDDRRLLRAHLAGPAAWVDPHTGQVVGGGIPLDVDAAALREAAADWSGELDLAG